MCFVDELFASAVELGAPVLAAQFPRAWLDVNREPYELDPKLFKEPLPAHANSRSMRLPAGWEPFPPGCGEFRDLCRKAKPG